MMERFSEKEEGWRIIIHFVNYGFHDLNKISHPHSGKIEIVVNIRIWKNVTNVMIRKIKTAPVGFFNSENWSKYNINKKLLPDIIAGLTIKSIHWFTLLFLFIFYWNYLDTPKLVMWLVLDSVIRKTIRVKIILVYGSPIWTVHRWTSINPNSYSKKLWISFVLLFSRRELQHKWLAVSILFKIVRLCWHGIHFSRFETKEKSVLFFSIFNHDQ